MWYNTLVSQAAYISVLADSAQNREWRYFEYQSKQRHFSRYKGWRRWYNGDGQKGPEGGALMDWISVKDRKPREGQHIMLTVRYKDWNKPPETKPILLADCIFEAEKYKQLCVDGKGGVRYEEIWYKLIVTHWMPYPAPASD